MLQKEFALLPRCNPQGYPQKLWIDVIGVQSDCHVARNSECMRVNNDVLAFVSAAPFPGVSFMPDFSIWKERYIFGEYAEQAPQGDSSTRNRR